MRRDLRFSPLAPLQAARVKVLSTPEAFPSFGIPGSGCARGKAFMRVELVSAFDGAPAGQRVVLRLDDDAFPRGKVGDTLGFTGLRRAGVGPDGTFVYCGKLSAARRASAAATPAPP